MKQKTLGEVTPHFFEDKLIISLSKDWMRLFNEIPKFKVILDRKNQLILQGPTIQKSSLRKNSLSEHKKMEVLV